MFYLIFYDIPDDQRRSRLAKTLKGFGTRVQYSVFEAHLSRTEFEELKRAVARVINPDWVQPVITRSVMPAQPALKCPLSGM